MAKFASLDAPVSLVNYQSIQPQLYMEAIRQHDADAEATRKMEAEAYDKILNDGTLDPETKQARMGAIRDNIATLNKQFGGNYGAARSAITEYYQREMADPYWTVEKQLFDKYKDIEKQAQAMRLSGKGVVYRDSQGNIVSNPAQYFKPYDQMGELQDPSQIGIYAEEMYDYEKAANDMFKNIKTDAYTTYGLGKGDFEGYFTGKTSESNKAKIDAYLQSASENFKRTKEGDQYYRMYGQDAVDRLMKSEALKSTNTEVKQEKPFATEAYQEQLREQGIDHQFEKQKELLGMKIDSAEEIAEMKAGEKTKQLKDGSEYEVLRINGSDTPTTIPETNIRVEKDKAVLKVAPGAKYDKGTDVYYSNGVPFKVVYSADELQEDAKTHTEYAKRELSKTGLNRFDNYFIETDENGNPLKSKISPTLEQELKNRGLRTGSLDYIKLDANKGIYTYASGKPIDFESYRRNAIATIDDINKAGALGLNSQDRRYLENKRRELLNADLTNIEKTKKIINLQRGVMSELSNNATIKDALRNVKERYGIDDATAKKYGIKKADIIEFDARDRNKRVNKIDAGRMIGGANVENGKKVGSGLIALSNGRIEKDGEDVDLTSTQTREDFLSYIPEIDINGDINVGKKGKGEKRYIIKKENIIDNNIREKLEIYKRINELLYSEKKEIELYGAKATLTPGYNENGDIVTYISVGKDMIDPEGLKDQIQHEIANATISNEVK